MDKRRERSKSQWRAWASSGGGKSHHPFYDCFCKNNYFFVFATSHSSTWSLLKFSGMWQMFKGVIKSLVVEEAGRVPQPLFHYICHQHTFTATIHPTSPSVFRERECSATYSCLITFGSLAGWRRKFGAWLEPSMRDSRCSIVSKSTPSCSLLLSAMDSDVVFYSSLTDMLHGIQAWERLLIDIWKVANNGLLWWVKKADNVVNIQQLPMWWEKWRGHWSAISDRPHHLPESLIIEQPLIWSSIFR